MSAIERAEPAGTEPTNGSGPGWLTVCRSSDLVPDRGVAVLVDGHQVAVFLLAALDGDRPASLHAVDNHDPCSGANVMARGLVGSAGETVFVASPLHKERFDLCTGRCLDGPAVLAVHDARIADGWVQVRRAGVESRELRAAG
jgi:nitrite reductase (NADH) small subunit